MIRNIAGERAVFCPDLHVPYQDEKAVGAALAFIKWFKPNHLFLLGDVVDFYGVSHFVRDPKRKLELQQDIDQSVEMIQRFAAAAPNAAKHFIRGNHELRMEKYIFVNAEELSSLRSLKVENLLHLKEIGFRYHENGWMMFHGMLIKHGNVVRQKSAHSAMAELEKNGLSGISGHTHRLGQYFVTNQSGMYTWVEGGCLCTLQPEWMESQNANWQHGLTVGYTEKGDPRFSLSPLPIISGKLLFDLKLFSK